MVQELQNYIGGQWTDLSFDKRAELVDPSTGQVFASAPVSSPAEVEAAVASAAAAFGGWRDTTPAERSLALIRIADAIEARADEFVKAEAENTGKPLALTASEEIPPMVDQIRFFAGAARMLEGRSAGVVSRQPPNAAAAEATAASTSVGLETGAEAKTWPVLGSTSSARWSKDRSVHWPPM